MTLNEAAAIPRNGLDDYGRRWRLASSGVEHMQKAEGSESGSPWYALATSGEIVAYCGRIVTDLPLSETRGDSRPCASCLRAEFSDDAE